MDLENKVSLVTGAGQGIGEGIAKTLAEKGSKVILVDLNQDSSEKVAEEINNKFSNSAYSFKADLTKSEEIEDMLKFGVSKYSKIDCICNNAASSQGSGPVENYSLEDVQTTLDLTFTSLWKCLQAEIKFLKLQDISASVVNISSLLFLYLTVNNSSLNCSLISCIGSLALFHPEDKFDKTSDSYRFFP